MEKETQSRKVEGVDNIQYKKYIYNRHSIRLLVYWFKVKSVNRAQLGGGGGRGGEIDFFNSE